MAFRKHFPLLVVPDTITLTTVPGRTAEPCIGAFSRRAKGGPGSQMSSLIWGAGILPLCLSGNALSGIKTRRRALSVTASGPVRQAGVQRPGRAFGAGLGAAETPIVSPSPCQTSKPLSPHRLPMSASYPRGSPMYPLAGPEAPKVPDASLTSFDCSHAEVLIISICFSVRNDRKHPPGAPADEG